MTRLNLICDVVFGGTKVILKVFGRESRSSGVEILWAFWLFGSAGAPKTHKFTVFWRFGPAGASKTRKFTVFWLFGPAGTPKTRKFTVFRRRLTQNT